MNRRGLSRLRVLVFFCLASAGFLYWRYPYPAAQPGAIELPPGFRLEVYAADVENARSLALGDRGTVFVGTLAAGRVYALVDRDRDGRAERVITIAQGLTAPNGVAFLGGALYVAEVNRVIRFDSIETRLGNPPPPVIVTSGLPARQGPDAKVIRAGPDNLLYLTVSAPCNVCQPTDARSASIVRFAPDGTSLEVFANGVRHSLGLDWHPETATLWFTDMGRDGLGANLPPDELNRAPRPGLHFGFPFCFGREIADPDFADLGRCDATVAPELELDPRIGAMGMRFYRGTMFPDEYRGQILIAEHGSDQRAEPAGFRITAVRLRDRRPVGYDVFASGWVRSRSAWGRPVDLLEMPDGAVLVSDDRAGAVYRITYEP